MSVLTHGSLFAGIGGFALAASWAGIKNVWSNEIDPYCCSVLNNNFNHEIIQKDIREIGKHNLQPVSIISGGFPCQPFSQAGKRQGKSDHRYLWPEMLRVISELQPSYIIGENVAGLLTMENGRTLDRILADLENEGYRNEVFIIPACGVGAWHRRERIWIISTRNNIYTSCTNTNSERSHRTKINQQRKTKLSHKQECKPGQMGKDVSNSDNPRTRTSRSRNNKERQKKDKERKDFTQSEFSRYGQNITHTECQTNGQHTRKLGCQANETSKTREGEVFDTISRRGSEVQREWEIEPNVGRVAHGIPNRVDRLKGLGNAIVPQVAYQLFKAIQEIE